ncbi:hypothetical protein BC835DRAFT_781296 [Cytidiella melzeri]|nr:hypothetical protein BC835DRAFT_781296 [Cytidiella melzeri]
MDPPGLNTPFGHTDSSHRTPHLEHGPIGTSAKSESRGLSRSGTERSIGEISHSKGGLDSKDDLRSSRDTDWSHRAAGSTQDDSRGSKYGHYKYGANGRPNGETRYGNNDNNRPGMRYQRVDYDRDKDRERDRERDRDWERDRERLRRYEHTARFDDRRNDDRTRPTDTRRPPPEQRNYEPKTNDPLRHWDSKSSTDSTVPPAVRPLDSRSTETRPPRPLTEERSFDVRDGRPLTEERAFDARVPRPLGQERSFDSRGPRALPEERPLDLRGLRPSLNGRQPVNPSDEDRTSKPAAVDESTPLPPASVTDRLSRSGDKARTPPASGKPAIEDRRPANYSPPNTRSLDQRSSVDDRRAPSLPHTQNSPANAVFDRRPPPLVPSDNQRPPNAAANSERSVRGPGDYPVRSTPASATDRAAETNTTLRPPPSQDGRSGPPRTQVPLEERIGRPASLQERLSTRPSDVTAARSDDRGTRHSPANEQRSSAHSLHDRESRTVPEPVDTMKPTSDTASSNTTINDTRNANSDASRGPIKPVRNGPRAMTGARYSTGSWRPTTSESLEQPPRHTHLDTISIPSTREDAEPPYKTRAATISPRRAEYRPSDRSSYPDRYERDASRERRLDSMDVDAPRYAERLRRGNRPPSPPPTNRGPRTWPHTGEPYSLHPQEPSAAHETYGRDWHGDERADYDEWQRRSWERERPVGQDHEFDRDPRYLGRDSTALGWETREARERRLASGYGPDAPSVTHPYENRAQVARLYESYPPDERDRSYERARYPEPTPASTVTTRVRPRSPSPARRAGMDDLQPPLKRSRDDAYGPSYYPPPPSRDTPRDYPLPPPATPMYYDDARADHLSAPAAPGGPHERRDRAFQERDYSGYDHRDTVQRTPAYVRDERRYGLPPPRP